MTLVEFAEKISPIPLIEWQKKFLEAYEQSHKESRVIMCVPPRISGKMMMVNTIRKFEEELRKMDIKEFAKMIDGKQYGYPQFTKEELQIAKDNGFVIVYGVSDDLMEFDGAIHDEGGCYDGGEVWFNRERVTDGPITTAERCIEALWCKEDDITWTYKTDIPHETFMIYEDDEKYCRGIVFNILDI